MRTTRHPISTTRVRHPRPAESSPHRKSANTGHHTRTTTDRFDRGARANGPTVLGGGSPSVDLNGTKYTRLEGRAASTRTSIDSKRAFDPLTEPGIALTTGQARRLGVTVGDQVTVGDTVTGKKVTATFYDSAGAKPDGLKHFEVSPALADALGIKYRDASGKVVDAVTNTESLRGRFAIERS